MLPGGHKAALTGTKPAALGLAPLYLLLPPLRVVRLAQDDLRVRLHAARLACTHKHTRARSHERTRAETRAPTQMRARPREQRNDAVLSWRVQRHALLKVSGVGKFPAWAFGSFRRLGKFPELGKFRAS